MDIDHHIEKEMEKDLKIKSNRYPNFCPKCECNIPTHCEYCGLLPMGNGCFVPTEYKDRDIIYNSR